MFVLPIHNGKIVVDGQDVLRGSIGIAEPAR
jgi:hypothetical protein